METLKRTLVCALLIIIMILTGCRPNNKSDYNRNSLVAALNLDCQVSINNDGAVNVIDKTRGSGFDFSDWQDIKSVSASEVQLGAIKVDGSVVMTGYPGFVMDLTDWKDIDMLEFTDFAAYGLKEDGTIIFQNVDDSQVDETVNETVKVWRDISYIDTGFQAIVGVTKNGKVVASVPQFPDLEKRVNQWEDIKMVSISNNFFGRARIVAVKNNGEIVEERYEESEIIKYDLESYEDLKGAVKICAGDYFTAGLMPDGTLKVRCGLDYDKRLMSEVEGEFLDLRNLDNTKDVADINSFEDILVVLKNDGTILVGGFED
ncbi:MAG: hypothetical protein BWY11_01074 [Firmicutes bacterium ADurb.Bin182]|nr:MAG: hypothetical protein BWY11_01074 [Firmicutes bacterium ADurb.Bin182]